MWGRAALITHHLCEMKGPESSQPPCWTQLSCWKKCLTGVAGTWPSLYLYLSLSTLNSHFLFFFSLDSHSLVQCHCFATGRPLLPFNLLGVVRELTVPIHLAVSNFSTTIIPACSSKEASISSVLMHFFLRGNSKFDQNVLVSCWKSWGIWILISGWVK